jgi:hypothetical protein
MNTESINFNKNKYSMGWGEPGDSISHRLIKERYNQETVSYCFCSINDIEVKSNPMEELCRSMFKFDDGWCFNSSETLLYGSPLIHNQGNVGSCVGAGGGLALAAKASQEILNEGDPEEPYGTVASGNNFNHAMPFTGYHYGCGRCKRIYNEASDNFNGTLRDNNDGSYCSVQIWAYRTCGILPNNLLKIKSSPFPQSEDVRSWGNNKNNELNNHLDIGRKFLMENSVIVKSSDDIIHVVTNLKQPCHICSGWGFAPDKTDSKYGILLHKKSGSWAHNMTIYGVIKIKDNWFVVVKNSWGEQAHPEAGRDIPKGCFVITIDLFSRWIKEAECMSIGELNLKESVMPWR